MTAPITPSGGGVELLPYTWGYTYPDNTVRFNGGVEVNGGRPTGVIPLYDEKTVATLKARIEELETALKPFAKTGWMTSEIEHTARTVVAHMHPESQYEIILSSEDFQRARAALASKGGVK